MFEFREFSFFQRRLPCQRSLKNILILSTFQVLERDQKLSDLGDRATALQNGASQFEQSSRKLKRRYWWQNTKMNIIIGAVVAIILIVILVEIFK